MEILYLFYVLLTIVGLIVAIALILAPLKLYQIAREMNTLNETMRDHTRLLAAIANATNPVGAMDGQSEVE